MATVKCSDDPMDLGGFMQNFVLSNPFKDMPGMAPANSKLSAKPCDPGHLSPRSPVINHSGASSPHSNHSNVTYHDNSDGSQEAVDMTRNHGKPDNYVITDKVGQVLDTPKGHVGSNVTYATALKLQQVALPHVKVQTWLKENYCHVKQYFGIKDAKTLLQEVNDKFPHVTGIILSKIMTFTFPDCSKVPSVNGGQGYRGLVAKPQPEDYCNLKLLKAASYAKKTGLISLAADEYDLPEASVASLHFWHPELGGATSDDAGTDTEMCNAKECEGSSLSQPDQQTATSPHKTRRHKRRRKIPEDFCDPDTLTDIEEDAPPARKQKLPPGEVKENHPLLHIKRETEDPQVESSPGSTGTCVPSLLRNLLKNSQAVGSHVEPINTSETVSCDPSPVPDTPLVIVKTEPLDPDDASPDAPQSVDILDNTDAEDQRIADDRQSSTDGSTAVDLTYANNAAVNGVQDRPRLAAQVDRLQASLSRQQTQNHRLESELLASKREASSLRSTLCAQEALMTDLVQDFASLHEQFRNLTNKFTSTLTALEENRSKLSTTHHSKKRKSHPSKLRHNGAAS